jgi:hypothetical protein
MGQILFAQRRTRDEREHRESRLTTRVIGLARTKRRRPPDKEAARRILARREGRSSAPKVFNPLRR